MSQDETLLQRSCEETETAEIFALKDPASGVYCWAEERLERLGVLGDQPEGLVETEVALQGSVQKPSEEVHGEEKPGKSS
jgi:hypothetical protein